MSVRVVPRKSKVVVRTNQSTPTVTAGTSVGTPGPSGDTGSIVALGNISGALNLSAYTLGSQLFTCVLTGNVTLAPSGMPARPAGATGTFSVRFQSDNNNTARTIALDSAIKAPYGNKPTFSGAVANTPNVVDIWTFMWDGTQWIVLVSATDVR